MPNPSGATASFAGPTTVCLATIRNAGTEHRTAGGCQRTDTARHHHLPIQTIQTIISCSFWRERRKIYVDELLLLQGLIPAQLTSASSAISRFFFYSVYPPNFSYVFPTFSTSQTFESIYVKVYRIHNCHLHLSRTASLIHRHEIVVCRSRKVKKKCGRK